MSFDEFLHWQRLVSLGVISRQQMEKLIEETYGHSTSQYSDGEVQRRWAGHLQRMLEGKRLVQGGKVIADERR